MGEIEKYEVPKHLKLDVDESDSCNCFSPDTENHSGEITEKIKKIKRLEYQYALADETVRIGVRVRLKCGGTVQTKYFPPDLRKEIEDARNELLKIKQKDTKFGTHKEINILNDEIKKLKDEINLDEEEEAVKKKFFRRLLNMD